MVVINEKEILDSFENAIHNHEICVYYQPKFNHATGRIIGAETLMRWKHHKYGMLSPVLFVPVFEKYKLIHIADLCVFERVCQFLKDCPPELRIPISFNVSRHDLYMHDYIHELEIIRTKYNVPVKYLQAEITETSAIGGMELFKNAIDNFHKHGYLVAMDDFGSGYSSLSILKSLTVDILKLDLRFLVDDGIDGRGGIILNSIVQMSKWLETQIIAEGVETIVQANFLKSIGCNYVQGYLYSKPIPEDKMKEMLNKINYEPVNAQTTFIPGLKIKQFWNPDSLETIIFNSFIGAAAIFSYKDKNIELIRVNEKYAKEFGMGLSEMEILNWDPLEKLDKEYRNLYIATIQRAIRSKEEEECITWRTIQSGCCGIEHICIRSNIKIIGKTDDQAIVYAVIRNITEEKKQLEKITSTDKTFRHAIEQANIYAWEYIVDTKEMHPCFRCMRDLGLPPVVKNYPEPAIQAGIFPPDYADMYRDWHKQIAKGVKNLEAIIPLTAGRIPFKVRYTTEFDENGKPLKAYGSATLIQDNE